MKKELAGLEDDSKKPKLQQRIHNAEVDVNYAIYYPLMKPYSSLYPKSKTRKNDDSEDGDEDGKSKSDETDGPKGDVDMWRAVERAMEEGTLEQLRYNKEAVPAEPPKKSKKPVVKDKKKDNASMAQSGSSKTYATQEQDEDSDGGFFE